MSPFRDNPEMMKLQEQLDTIKGNVWNITQNVSQLFEYVREKHEKKTVYSLYLTFKNWAYNNEWVAFLWYPVRWFAILAIAGYATIVGGRMGCAYVEASDHRVQMEQEAASREFCTRVCTGVGSTYVGRNEYVHSNDPQLQELSEACLCARAGHVFAVNCRTGREIYNATGVPQSGN